MPHKRVVLVGGVTVLAVLFGCASQTAKPAIQPLPEAKAESVSREQSVKPGINDNYKNANVTEWVERLESESREIFKERERIVQATGVAPGMTIADVGAGTGFFSVAFAKAVGKNGKVFSVDITPEFLGRIRRLAADEKLTNIQTVLCKEDSVELPPSSVDLAFICDTYHHFEYPHSTMKSVHQALRRGGMLVLIDFKCIKGQSSDWVLEHVRAGQEVFTSEIIAAGFEPVPDTGDTSFLTENYLVKFRKQK